MKKGSIHPSDFTQLRKRKGTMVNPTELPPNSPTIVKINSNDTYTEEMLPSGEIVRIRKDSQTSGNSDQFSNRAYRKIFRSSKNKDVEGDDGVSGMNSHSIDEILRERQRGLEEGEEWEGPKLDEVERFYRKVWNFGFLFLFLQVLFTKLMEKNYMFIKR